MRESGAEHEQIEEQDGDDNPDVFDRTISSLADDLMFPAPFDLASAAALAANLDTGESAVSLFHATASRDVHYDVQISALIPGQPDLPPREILGTIARSTPMLIHLLEMLIVELRERQTETGE